MAVESMGGSRYFMTRTDNHSHWSDVFCIKIKSDVFGSFKKWKAKAERQSSSRIRTPYSDNGVEYMSGEFKVYLEKCGIKQELTVLYTPQQNEVAERLNRTLLDSVRTILQHRNCKKMWWAEAVSTSCYIKNRVTMSGIAHPRVFRSKCWYVNAKTPAQKLADQSCEAMMI
jgi:hypothetical protein